MKRKRPNKLETYLFQRSLTPAVVAEAANARGCKLAAPTIYTLMTGKSRGSRRTRYALATVLKITTEEVDKLLDGK